MPEDRVHNGHMYYIKVRDLEVRTELISWMKEKGVHCVFHYIPLHTAPAGQKYGRFHGEDVYTTRESETADASPHVLQPFHGGREVRGGLPSVLHRLLKRTGEAYGGQQMEEFRKKTESIHD